MLEEKRLVGCLRLHEVILATLITQASSCRKGEEPRIDLVGPSVVLTTAAPRHEFLLRSCVVRSPPDEGLVIDVEGTARLVSGDRADVEMYVEIGDALFDEEDGDTDIASLSPSTPESDLHQLAGARADTAKLTEVCTDGLDVTFTLLEGVAAVEIEWSAAVFTIGAGWETEVEGCIEERASPMGCD